MIEISACLISVETAGAEMMYPKGIKRTADDINSDRQADNAHHANAAHHDDVSGPFFKEVSFFQSSIATCVYELYF